VYDLAKFIPRKFGLVLSSLIVVVLSSDIKIAATIMSIIYTINNIIAKNVKILEEVSKNFLHHQILLTSKILNTNLLP
jgi:hypothetical protein